MFNATEAPKPRASPEPLSTALAIAVLDMRFSAVRKTLARPRMVTSALDLISASLVLLTILIARDPATATLEPPEPDVDSARKSLVGGISASRRTAFPL